MHMTGLPHSRGPVFSSGITAYHDPPRWIFYRCHTLR